MAFANHTPPAPFGAIAIFNLINDFETAVKAVSEWNTNRKTVTELSALSDHQLFDIGLSRCSIANLPARF